jgi:hypothetical protein
MMPGELPLLSKAKTCVASAACFSLVTFFLEVMWCVLIRALNMNEIRMWFDRVMEVKRQGETLTRDCLTRLNFPRQ